MRLCAEDSTSTETAFKLLLFDLRKIFGQNENLCIVSPEVPCVGALGLLRHTLGQCDGHAPHLWRLGAGPLTTACCSTIYSRPNQR
eukprot:scaffold517_cov255-Pinguiococcus_pyrenoidosus.AAC.34